MVYSANLEIVTIQNGDTDKITTIGLVTVNQNSVYIEFDSNNSQKNCIGISSGIVTITKIGEDSYTIVLEEGKTTGTTAIFGNFKINLSIHTKAIYFEELNDRFNLELAYTLTFNGDSIVENIVKVRCDYINENKVK